MYSETYINFLCGWSPDEEGTKKIVSELPFETFAQFAPDLMQDDGEDALLYKAMQKVYGKNIPARNQLDGTCTSQGTANALDYLQGVEIAIKGDEEKYKPVAAAPIYGLGREIAGMLGRGAGCYGAAVAKAAAQGIIDVDSIGDNLKNDALGTKYGRSGVPSDVKTMIKAAGHVLSFAPVRTAEEARGALRSGYPGIVCSNRGFTMERDSTGKCSPKGNWAHCMAWIAFRAKLRQFLIVQSWNENTPSGPTPDDIPTCSFWVDWDVFNSMLRQDDSFCFSNLNGFPDRREQLDKAMFRPFRG